MVDGDYDEESPSAERLEPVGTEQYEKDNKIPVATQLDDGDPNLRSAVLMYLGSLPESIAKDRTTAPTKSC
jgi:hypothetical protein